MKKLIALALLATSTPAMAADLTAKDIKFCKLVGLSAKSIMTGRQLGLAPTKVYESLGEIYNPKLPDMMEFMVILIKEAYDKKSYFSEDLRTKAISDFQAEQELFCFKSMAKDSEAAQ